jgi:hypothetical protein
VGSVRCKTEVKKQISARGERVGDYSHRDLVLQAEVLLKERPEFIREAWARAREEFGLDQVA